MSPSKVVVNDLSYTKFRLQQVKKTLEKICAVLPLTGVSIKQDDIVQYHRLKKKTHVIVKLKERQKRYDIMLNISKLKGKK